MEVSEAAGGGAAPPTPRLMILKIEVENFKVRGRPVPLPPAAAAPPHAAPPHAAPPGVPARQRA